MTLRQKYIGDRTFYKVALSVALPIMIQNFISNLVNMLDNLMIGAVGTEQLSAVYIINQLIFVFNLALFGALSGAGIFTAQFYGRQDTEGIRHTVRYKAYIATLLAAAAIAVLLCFGQFLAELYIHDIDASVDLEATRRYAMEYLRIILLGIPPFAVSMVAASTLRETGETLTPMLCSFAAVFTNCLFNYLLIFGKLGLPALGVTGAAIATSFSRYAECALLVFYCLRHRDRFPYFHRLFASFRIPMQLFSLINRKGLPLLVNEFLWSGSISLIGMGYSLHGLHVVAAYSISSTVSNLFSIAFISIGSAIGILVGKELGADRFREAVDSDRKLIVFSLFISALLGAACFLLGGLLPTLYRNTTEASRTYATYFIRVTACIMPLHAFANAAYFTLRSGGKTLVTFFFDSVFMWVVSVPCVFLLTRVAGLSVTWVYPITESMVFIKCIVGYVLLKRKIWVHNIVSG